MTLNALQKKYPAAEISATRVAAYYREDGVTLSVYCQIDPGTGFATEGSMQAAIDALAEKIAKLKA